MNNQSKIALVYHHLGLGDHFVCNGIVRFIADALSCNRLYLPVKSHNLGTIFQMYSDDSRIVPLSVLSDSDVPLLPEVSSNIPIVRVGFEKCRPNDWDVSFYHSVGLSYDIRWTHFKINRNPMRERLLDLYFGLNPTDKFVLVHEDSSVGTFPIKVDTDLRIIKVKKVSDSLIDWCGLIERAEEVHCIDSSFIHLAQSIRPDGVFHKIRDAGKHAFCIKDGWEMKRYD